MTLRAPATTQTAIAITTAVVIGNAVCGRGASRGRARLQLSDSPLQRGDLHLPRPLLLLSLFLPNLLSTVEVRITSLIGTIGSITMSTISTIGTIGTISTISTISTIV